MYQVFADDILIYDDTRTENTLKLVSPRLSLSDSAAGSFTMTVPTINPGYDYIQRMTTTIKVIKEGHQLWEGRVIQESFDFYNQRKLTCEGELAYLNDVTLPQRVFSYSSGNMVKQFLTDIIAIYNASADADKQFAVGTVTVSPFEPGVHVLVTFDRTTNYEKVIECINNQLVAKLGGHIRIRHEIEYTYEALKDNNGNQILDDNGDPILATVGDGVDVRYIDYLEDYFNVNSQTVNFAKNLIDFTRSYDSTEYATAILPLGPKLEGDDIPAGESKVGDLDYYLTIKSAAADSMHTAGSLYVESSTAISNFGRLEKVVKFEDAKDANDLLLMGERYLTDIQYDTMVLELTAFDLHYLNPEMEPFKIGDKVQVISEPHDLDHVFPVVKLDIPLDEPDNTKFTLGDSVKTTLTATNNKVNAEIKQKIESGPDASTIIDEVLADVQDDVTDIMNERMNGYVTITNTTDQSGTYSEALIISDRKPYTASGAKYWRWNINGLGFWDGSSWKTAMTMDGTILGERIAAASIHASKLTANSLQLVTSAGQTSCSISIQDSNGRVIASAANIQINGMVTFTNLDSHLATAGSTTINGGNITTGTISADRIDTTNLHVKNVYPVDSDTLPILSSILRSSNRVLINFGASDYNRQNYYYVFMNALNFKFSYSAYDWMEENDYQLYIDPITRCLEPGGSRVWDLGTSYHPFNRLYLGTNRYIYLRSGTQLCYYNDGTNYPISLMT